MATRLNRRRLLAAAVAVPAFAPIYNLLLAAETERVFVRPGKLKQSVMGQVWAGTDFTLEERCELLSIIGFSGIDLPRLEDIPVMRDWGLAPTVMTASGTGTSFQNGLVRTEIHDQIFDAMHVSIDQCAEVGCPNLIAFPGERRGMSREEGAEHAAAILARVGPYAQSKGVNICMEITNSKVAADNRTDQMFDDIHWGFKVCEMSGSPAIQVVYDFYHVQIANGDVVRTLQDNLKYVCHIHVAGVPSRREIDETQELNYHFIAQQIAEMGYQGYVAHEYRAGDGRTPLESLATGFRIMTV